MYRKSVSLKTNIKFQNFNYFRPLAKLKIMKLYNNKILEIELKKKNTYGSRTKAQKLTWGIFGGSKRRFEQKFSKFLLTL